MTLDQYLFQNFPELTPFQFYRMIFPSGELDKAGAMTPGKYTGIVTRITDRKRTDGRPKIYRYSLTDELEAIETATNSDDFCICRPLSYAGKEATADRARFCYAIAVDVDKLRRDKYDRPLGVINLWERHVEKVKRIPKPTAIVSSGTGIHLYYVLETPIALFRDAAFELQELKRELTRIIWHDTIVDIKNPDEIQQEGIYQGFRIPGTITKAGGRARAFLTGERVTVEYLNSFVPDLYKAKKAATQRHGKMRLAEAREKYPEWYENRIQNGKKPGAWATSRAVYEWWKREITEKASVGHRYYCLMTLAMYAEKCSHYDEKHNPQPVTREELEKDCFDLLEHMESLTESPDNHFDEADILDALEAFDSKWIKYPRDAIARRTGIEIPANKRNRREQKTHLRIARATEDILYPGGEWRENNGRKSKAEIVQAWRRDHPEGTRAACQRETGISKPTVLKWWNHQPEPEPERPGAGDLLRELDVSWDEGPKT